MKYKNAQDILPDRLLRELQSYVSGEMLYVPNEDSKRQWGEASGARSYYKQRKSAGDIFRVFRQTPWRRHFICL